MSVPTRVRFDSGLWWELVGPRPAGAGGEVWPRGAEGEAHLVAGRRWWWLRYGTQELRVAYDAAARCWREELRGSEAEAWRYEGSDKWHSEACDGAAPPKDGTWVSDTRGYTNTLRWGDKLVPEAEPPAPGLGVAAAGEGYEASPGAEGAAAAAETGGKAASSASAAASVGGRGAEATYLAAEEPASAGGDEVKEVEARTATGAPSMATSYYLKIYKETKQRAPRRLYALLGALDAFLQSFATKHAVPEADLERFYVQLEEEAIDATRRKGDSLSDIQAVATRIWSSKKQLTWRSIEEEVQKEFCSILNAAIRDDDQQLLDSGMISVHAINQLCVRARTDEVRWPADHQCYRGGGLPVEHQRFFTVGKQYRVPMFLATTINADIALGTFALRAVEQNLPPVLFVIRLDPTFHCMHVNFLGEKSLVDEEEFLFAPYSAFRVLEVEFHDDPDLFDGRPNRIVLAAEIDNKRVPEDLPLAPWH